MWHRTRRRLERLFRPVPLPGEESDYRAALALGMSVARFRHETTCVEYLWWIALLNDNQRREREALEEAERKAKRGG